MKKFFLGAAFLLAASSGYAQKSVQNGVELNVGDALMRVEFVKSDVVRVRDTRDGKVVDVDNDICVKREPESVKM